MNFLTAFEKLLKHEGGYSNHPADPGGKTRYGITEAVAREVGYRGNMNELPLELAQRIYKEKYWDAVQAEALPPDVRTLFLMAGLTQVLSNRPSGSSEPVVSKTTV